MSTGNPNEGVSPGDATYEYNPAEDMEPAATVIEAVTSAMDVEVTDLEPLQRTLDIDALNALFRHSRNPMYRSATSSESADPKVKFCYGGCLVTVTRDRVRVQPGHDQLH